jgi:predicted nucleic acid-binding protein
LTEIGLKAKDALHIACAIEGKANYYLTTDDEILKKCSTYKFDYTKWQRNLWLDKSLEEISKAAMRSRSQKD